VRYVVFVSVLLLLLMRVSCMAKHGNTGGRNSALRHVKRQLLVMVLQKCSPPGSTPRKPLSAHICSLCKTQQEADSTKVSQGQVFHSCYLMLFMV
jgi:hypothetical protein